LYGTDIEYVRTGLEGRAGERGTGRTALDRAPIQFDYKPSPLHIIDNGRTVMINYGPGSFLLVAGRGMHSNNSTFIGPARRGSTARAMRWRYIWYTKTRKASWQ
jgi:hypothetical protein